MQAYYGGLDMNKVLIENHFAPTPVKTKINFVELKSSRAITVYRRSATHFTWTAQGIPGPKLPLDIFPSDSRVNKVVLADGTVIGLSTLNHKLYLGSPDIIDYTVKEELEWRMREIKLPKDYENIKFEDIACYGLGIEEDKMEVYLTDDNGGIYKLNISLNKDDEVGVEFLFRLDNHKIKKISSGTDHKLVLTDTGAIYAWGIGSRGQLGLGDIILNCTSPKRIEFFDDLPCTVVDISSGGWHSLALTSDGDIYAWGWNKEGQVGIKSTSLNLVVPIPSPIDLGSDKNPVVGISTGPQQSAALMKNGEVYTWGYNAHQQLAQNDRESKQVRLPRKVNTDGMGKVTKIFYTTGGIVLYCI